jgi:acyl-CoA hydrolase
MGFIRKSILVLFSASSLIYFLFLNRKDKKHGNRNKLDWAIVEATAITEDGGIVPGESDRKPGSK